MNDIYMDTFDDLLQDAAYEMTGKGDLLWLHRPVCGKHDDDQRHCWCRPVPYTRAELRSQTITPRLDS